MGMTKLSLTQKICPCACVSWFFRVCFCYSDLFLAGHWHQITFHFPYLSFSVNDIACGKRTLETNLFIMAPMITQHFDVRNVSSLSPLTSSSDPGARHFSRDRQFRIRTSWLWAIGSCPLCAPMRNFEVPKQKSHVCHIFVVKYVELLVYVTFFLTMSSDRDI